MDRTAIEFAPGVFRKGTFAQMAGRWYDTQLVRWVEGVLRPVGGIEDLLLFWNTPEPGTPFPGFASPVRATHVWMTRDSIVRVGVLCEKHLYVVTLAGEVVDISPTVAIQGPDDDVAGGYGDGIYYGAAGGLTDFTKLLPVEDPGPLAPIFTDPTGYGLERPGTPPTVVIGAMWTLDNFGDLLVAMASTDTRLLIWDPAAPTTPAAEVVPRPADAEMDPPDPGGGAAPRGRFFVITPERHCMVFNTLDGGAFPNRFEWCSQEDIKDWLYTNPNNSAGFYDSEPASPFVTAVPTSTGVLAFTTSRTYLIIYAGSPYFYSYKLLGDYAAPMSGGALVRGPAAAFWFARNGFWTFDGINIAQVPSTLLDYVQRRIDPQWGYRRMNGVYLGSQNEIWFFYPSLGQRENDSYIIYNFAEQWWAPGMLSRTCGSSGSAMNYPILSNGTRLFFHEKGDSYADAPILPYAQSGAINVLKGGRQATVRQGIADIAAPANDVQFRVGARRARISDDSGISDVEMALAIRRDEGKVDFRVTGRDIFIRIEAVRNGVPQWTFGQMLVKVIPRGSR